MSGTLVQQPILSPLPARFRWTALVLLAWRGFSPDALLVAADGYDRLANEFALDNAPAAAGEARQLAAQLRQEAPRRAGRARYTAALSCPRGQQP